MSFDMTISVELMEFSALMEELTSMEEVTPAEEPLKPEAGQEHDPMSEYSDEIYRYLRVNKRVKSTSRFAHNETSKYSIT